MKVFGLAPVQKLQQIPAGAFLTENNLRLGFAYCQIRGRKEDNGFGIPEVTALRVFSDL